MRRRQRRPPSRACASERETACLIRAQSVPALLRRFEVWERRDDGALLWRSSFAFCFLEPLSWAECRRLGQLATHVVCSARRGWGLACCRAVVKTPGSDPISLLAWEFVETPRMAWRARHMPTESWTRDDSKPSPSPPTNCATEIPRPSHALPSRGTVMLSVDESENCDVLFLCCASTLLTSCPAAARCLSHMVSLPPQMDRSPAGWSSTSRRSLMEATRSTSKLKIVTSTTSPRHLWPRRPAGPWTVDTLRQIKSAIHLP